jgi:hypothetical protein
MHFFWLKAGGAAAADEDVEQTKAKLQAVRKQLEELRQQEQALLKQLEQATREAAQRKEPYIKAKVKGILRHEGVYFPSLLSTPGGQVVQSWTITVEDTKWGLHFGDKKAFLELAKANEGEDGRGDREGGDAHVFSSASEEYVQVRPTSTYADRLERDGVQSNRQVRGEERVIFVPSDDTILQGVTNHSAASREGPGRPLRCAISAPYK